MSAPKTEWREPDRALEVRPATAGDWTASGSRSLKAGLFPVDRPSYPGFGRTFDGRDAPRAVVGFADNTR